MKLHLLKEKRGKNKKEDSRTVRHIAKSAKALCCDA
jgi:hypothetical protein